MNFSSVNRRIVISSCLFPLHSHGGPQASNWLAKELFPEVLSGLMGGKVKGADDMEKALITCFERGDEKLMSHLGKLGPDVLSSAGSTGTVIVVQADGRVAAANVGDSQAYLLRKGQAVPLTTPHRVYGSGGWVVTLGGPARFLSSDLNPVLMT
jgi:protein phosphatase 1L